MNIKKTELLVENNSVFEPYNQLFIIVHLHVFKKLLFS